MSFYVTKYSGQQELFNTEKFTRSLKKAGADDAFIHRTLSEIEGNPSIRTTRDIYAFALQKLHTHPATSARYAIKRALFQLGPSGFPFEKFVAEIFKAQGYETAVGQYVQGNCVIHEIDIIATRDNYSIIAECKFHNQQGIHSNVKVPLYVHARYEDVKKNWHTKPLQHAWVVTNTRFSAQAITYGQCAQLRLLGWSYPEHNGLQHLVERYHLFPITTLDALSAQHKQELLSKGIVLCKDLYYKKNLLAELGYSTTEIKKIADTIQQLCRISTS